MESDVNAKVVVSLIVSAALIGTILWRLVFSMTDVKIRQQIPISSQMSIGDDCVYRDEAFLFKTNCDAASAPVRASEKNQAMDRLMAGSDMAPEDFSSLMRRLHADGKQDELTRNFAVQHLGLYAGGDPCRSKVRHGSEARRAKGACLCRGAIVGIGRKKPICVAPLRIASRSAIIVPRMGQSPPRIGKVNGDK